MILAASDARAEEAGMPFSWLKHHLSRAVRGLERISVGSEDRLERRTRARAAIERARSLFQRHTWLLARYEQALAEYRRQEREHNQMVGLHRQAFWVVELKELDHRRWERSKAACDNQRLICDYKWQEVKTIETDLNLTISRLERAHKEMEETVGRAGITAAELALCYPEYQVSRELRSAPGQLPRDLCDVPPLETRHS